MSRLALVAIAVIVAVVAVLWLAGAISDRMARCEAEGGEWVMSRRPRLGYCAEP